MPSRPEYLCLHSLQTFQEHKEFGQAPTTEGVVERVVQVCVCNNVLPMFVFSVLMWTKDPACLDVWAVHDLCLITFIFERHLKNLRLCACILRAPRICWVLQRPRLA